jgi:hypothetical protein
MKHALNLSLVFLMLSLIFGCDSMTYQLPDDEKIVNRITEETAKKLGEREKLALIGTGGQMMHKIEMLSMSFQLFHEVDLQKAREIIVYAVREYLSDINNNEEVRPYLHNYPFTAKNVEIMIFVYGPDRRELPPQKIGYISSRNGILKYYNRADRDHPICKETYEEALGKIACSQRLDALDRNINKAVIINEVTAKGGAKIRIIGVNLEHSMYELNAEGLKPYESLNCISTSCHEVLYFRVKADKNGMLGPVGLMPAVIGKSGGICHIDILRKEASIHIKFPWGSESLKRLPKRVG